MLYMVRDAAGWLHPGGAFLVRLAGEIDGDVRKKEALDRVDGMLGVLAQDKARKGGYLFFRSAREQL